MKDQLFAKAILSKKNMLIAKRLIAELEMFELASELKELADKHFPPNEEQKEALLISTMLKLVGLDVNSKTAHILKNTFARYFEIGLDFSTKDAVQIDINANKLFE